MKALALGAGSLLTNMLEPEHDPEAVELNALMAWVLNTQSFEYEQGAETSANWSDFTGSGGMGEKEGGSTTYRASFQALDTLIWTEVTNPWVWAYVKERYPASCAFRPDSSGFTGGSTSSAVYTGGDSGCPAYSEWTEISPISDNPGAYEPTLDLSNFDSISNVFGYLVSNGRNPRLNLYVKTTLVEDTGCVATGEYPPLPDPDITPTAEASFSWNSVGATTCTWTENEITLTRGELLSKTRTESNTYDFEINSWEGWVTDGFTASVTSSRSETYTRNAFESWAFDATVFNSILESLGIEV